MSSEKVIHTAYPGEFVIQEKVASVSRVKEYWEDRMNVYLRATATRIADNWAKLHGVPFRVVQRSYDD